MSTTKQGHLFYIDNLRIVLISLIVLLHLDITYGGPGDWYYREYPFETISLLPQILYLIFNASIQAFTLGLFFMIAGYFTVASYDRKDARKFLKDRFTRLGIPVLFYIIVINPLLIYAVWGEGGNYVEFLGNYIRNTRRLGVGPLWFVVTLLIFASVYTAFRSMNASAKVKAHRNSRIPGYRSLALFALFMGIMTFIMRLLFPVGWVFEPLNLQFSHFSQYICMYVAGILAYRGNWFERIPKSMASSCLTAAGIFIAVFPVFIAFCGFTKGDVSTLGGANWQSLFYSVWEQFVCVGMATGLIGLFRAKLDIRHTLTQELSCNVYTVYVIHAPVLVFFCMALRQIDMYPIAKFLVLAPVVLAMNFMLASLIRRIPLVNKVL